MTNKFENKFHRWYVGGEGEIEETPIPKYPKGEKIGMSVEEILEHYRDYVGDPTAEFPKEIVEVLKIQGKIV